MEVSIIGATGDVGRQICARLIGERILQPEDTLKLISGTEYKVRGLISDLKDGYVEVSPKIEYVGIKDVVSDVVIFVAGKPTDRNSPDRSALGRNQSLLFEEYAKEMKKGKGHEIVIVVTNPVELGVHIFCKYMNHNKVIGMGAYQDSLRFRREIASELNVTRRHVSCFAGGEHGRGVVPLWSTLQVLGDRDLQLASRKLIHNQLDRWREKPFYEIESEEWEKIEKYVSGNKIQEAFDYVSGLSPDLRIVLKPRLIVSSEAKTIFSTANSTVDMISRMLSGRPVVMSAQVKVSPRQFYGVNTVFGIPVNISLNGWTHIETPELSDVEVNLVQYSTKKITDQIEAWTKPVS